MNKTLIAVAAFAAASSPALAADSIRIDLTGKSPDVIHNEIVQAARRVCYDRYAPSPLSPYLIGACVKDSVQDAEATIAQRSLSAQDKLASAK